MFKMTSMILLIVILVIVTYLSIAYNYVHITGIAIRKYFERFSVKKSKKS